MPRWLRVDWLTFGATACKCIWESVCHSISTPIVCNLYSGLSRFSFSHTMDSTSSRDGRYRGASVLADITRLRLGQVTSTHLLSLKSFSLSRTMVQAAFSLAGIEHNEQMVLEMYTHTHKHVSHGEICVERARCIICTVQNIIFWWTIYYIIYIYLCGVMFIESKREAPLIVSLCVSVGIIDSTDFCSAAMQCQAVSREQSREWRYARTVEYNAHNVSLVWHR